MMRFTLYAAMIALTAFSQAVSAQDLSDISAPRPVISEIVTGEAQRLRAFPGVIEPATRTDLGFLAAGQIATRPVSLGDRVRQGSVLATLDQQSLRNDREAVEAALRAAKARASLAQQSFTRAEELRRRGVAASAELEAATANRDAAAASVLAAEADLARARDAESYSELRAPSDGIVLAVHAEPGATVSVGMPVLTLASDSSLEAVIDVPTDMLALIEPGAAFKIWPRGVDAQSVDGRLRLIEPVADSASRAHRLRIAIDQPEGLRMGSMVQVRLDEDAAPVLSLPQTALIADGTAVWRVGDGRKLERVSVTTGLQLGQRVVIQSGVSEGDEILIRGVHSVEEGQIVGVRGGL